MPKQTFFNLPAAKRDNFLDIALAEFAENDFHSASISRIVAQAGIAKGSFYQYFENKEDLHRYLLELGAQEKAALFSAQPPAPAESVFDYLRRLLRAGVGFELHNPRLSQIGYRAVKSDSLPPEFLAQARAGSRAFFAHLIAQGQEQGDIDPAIDADLAAFVFGTLFTELGRYLMARLDGDEGGEDGRSPLQSPLAEALVDQMLHMLEFGIGQKEEA